MQSPAERSSSVGSRADTGGRFDQDVENLLETQRLAELKLAPAAAIAQAESVYVLGDRDKGRTSSRESQASGKASVSEASAEDV